MIINEKIKEYLQDYKLKKAIIKYYKDSLDDEIKDIISFLSSHRVGYYNYPWFKPDYSSVKIELMNNRPYVLYKKKKVFFPISWDVKRIVDYWSFLIAEQNEKSPHNYGLNNINIQPGECIIDAGGAEGLFTISLIDKISKAYIVECDAEWIEALKMTFKDYKHKVVIVSKFLSNSSCDDKIAIDDLVNIDDCISLIKMDIEGAEIEALMGGCNVLERDTPKLLLCAYHYQNEEEDLYNFLKEKGYSVKTNPGYILFKHDPKLAAPYLRRGLVVAERCKNE